MKAVECTGYGSPEVPRLTQVAKPTPRHPILGMERAGVVEPVGREVTFFTKGDEVLGFTQRDQAGSHSHSYARWCMVSSGTWCCGRSDFGTSATMAGAAHI